MVVVKAAGRCMVWPRLDPTINPSRTRRERANTGGVGLGLEIGLELGLGLTLGLE